MLAILAQSRKHNATKRVRHVLPSGKPELVASGRGGGGVGGKEEGFRGVEGQTSEEGGGRDMGLSRDGGWSLGRL